MASTGYVSTVVANKELDSEFGSGSPATHWFAYFTTAPDRNNAGGVEVSGGGYTRVGKTNDATLWPAASGGSKSNGVAIAFPMPSGTQGTVVAVGVFDASSGGNLRAVSLLASGVVVGLGDPAPTINIGDMVLTNT